jgi:hypothetical protein
MKRFAPPAGLQGNLPLVEMPSLEIPQQQELAIALMDLLVQVQRQIYAGSETAARKESPDGYEAEC